MNAQPPNSGSVTKCDRLKFRLCALIGIKGQTWRKIAEMPRFKGIPPGTLCAISKGYDPKNPEVRAKLHLDKPRTSSLRYTQNRRQRLDELAQLKNGLRVGMLEWKAK
jgi:hypothetical protein